MHFVFSTLLFVAGVWLASAAEVRQHMNFTSCVMRSCRNLSSCLQAQKLEPFILKNHRGVEAHILPYGAVVQKLTVPDRSGRSTDVVLGFDTLTPYEDGTSPYFGALVGRVANRIANATFELDGKTYHISANENTTSLHGGMTGFSKRLWKGHVFTEGEDSGVMLRYESPDGEEGYPGSLTATVTYLLTSNSELRINMEGSSQAPTPLNLAQHTYFNLNGQHTASTVLNHDVTIQASYITPVDKQLIPMGVFMPVAGTPYNLNNSTRLSHNIHQGGGLPDGYDINYVLFGLTGEQAKDKMLHGKVWDEPQPAVKISSPTTGITLEVATTSPGLQFYSGGLLSVGAPVTGKGGIQYPRFGGFAVETQNFPNAINTAAFPDSVLRPGHVYQNVCVWRFGTLPTPTRLRKLIMGLGLVLALAAAVTACMRYIGTGSRHRWHGSSYAKA
ncbi:hypothetical protein ABBQ38_012837 [Trebouxia sp. C0009 RCD-2024]